MSGAPGRTIRKVERFTANHVCDSPRCMNTATWIIHFDTNARLVLCAPHKEEVVANYRARP